MGYDMVSDQGLEMSFEDCCLSLSILCFLFVESINCSRTGMRPRYADLPVEGLGLEFELDSIRFGFLRSQAGL